MFLSNPWQQLLRGAALMALASAGMSLSACSSDKTATSSDPLSSSGVVREGVTTQAALNAFLGAVPDDWGWAGGVFDSPDPGDGGTPMAVISAATPEAFAWHADPTAAPNPSDTIVASKQNGQTFFLAFSVPENAKLLRVFTSLTTYTPDAATWQTLVSASQPITLSVTSATFENDALTPDGGPHSGETLSLTIQ
jgi:hypothetical protein